MGTDRLHLPTAVCAAMLTAAVVNVAQFPLLEIAASDWYEAVRIKPGEDLRDLAEGHFGSTQGRFELFVQLRDVAPGATVTLPPDIRLRTEDLVGLGRAEQVVTADAAPDLDPAILPTLEEALVAEGEQEDLGRYAIATASDGPDELVVWTGHDRTWFIDRALLGAGAGS